MSPTHREIMLGSAVTLHFSLSLKDGTEAISTFDEEPLSFSIGDKTFQQGFEIGLYGLKAGDEQSVTVSSDIAYGGHDQSLVQKMPLSDFTSDQPPEIDQIMSFLLAGNEETMGIIQAIDKDDVTVDFNHPLAGHDVVFKVKILDVGAPVDLSSNQETYDQS